MLPYGTPADTITGNERREVPSLAYTPVLYEIRAFDQRSDNGRRTIVQLHAHHLVCTRHQWEGFLTAGGGDNMSPLGLVSRVGNKGAHATPGCPQTLLVS